MIWCWSNDAEYSTAIHDHHTQIWITRQLCSQTEDILMKHWSFIFQRVFPRYIAWVSMSWSEEGVKCIRFDDMSLKWAYHSLLCLAEAVTIYRLVPGRYINVSYHSSRLTTYSDHLWFRSLSNLPACHSYLLQISTKQQLSCTA